MADPLQPPKLATAPADPVTGEWSSVTPAEAQAAAAQLTLTVSGHGGGPDRFIPNEFGRYSVVRLLGRGGMGSVFLAQDTQLDRPVALKVPSFRGDLTSGQKERFFREARAISALRHPNVCPIFDVDECGDTLYLTMAFIDGPTLAMELRDGPIDPTWASEIIRKVALGMQAAHDLGTIHRDLKPANIMIDAAGEPVVMDFGLARKGEGADDSSESAPSTMPTAIDLTQMGSVIGTPAYMPPEQATGDLTAIGPRSDVYALGAVFYECLTGKRPFDGPDTASVIQKILHVPPMRPREIVATLDPALEAVCLKAMAKRPEDRYASMADFAEAIEDALEPKLTHVEPPPLPGQRGRKRPKRGWVAPLSWGLFVLFVATICIGGPTAAAYYVLDRFQTIFQNALEANNKSEEWDSLSGLWQPPGRDPDDDDLFPKTVAGKFRLNTAGPAAADADLGLPASGRHAVYSDAAVPSLTYEVLAYHLGETEATALQRGIASYVAKMQAGSQSPGSNPDRRKVANYVRDDARQRVSYTFADADGDPTEYGVAWQSHGWLFVFKTTSIYGLESFAPKYLIEVAKQAVQSKREGKPRLKDRPKGNVPVGE